MKRHLTASCVAAISTLAPVGSFAQSSVPEPVIEQCTATATAAEMPDCLRMGAVAFEMIDLVRTDEFYGAGADDVIDVCGTRNETFASTWVCFNEAVRDAVETRNLIGVENIADRCVAVISDDETAIRVQEAYDAKRRERFPDAMFFPSQMYFPFPGCPVQDATEVGSATPSATEQDGSSEAGMGAEGCAAFREIETIVSTRSANDLRALAGELEMLDQDVSDEDRAELIGLSPSTAAYVFQDDPSHGLTVIATLGAFLHEYHPDLLMELFESQRTNDSSPMDDMSAEMARSFVTMIVTEAGAAYESACAAP